MKKHKPQFQKPVAPPVARPPMPQLVSVPSPGAHGVVDLTEQTLASLVDGHPFAILDFWAPLSAASRAFAPVYAAAAARHPDLLFARVNAEEQRAMVAQFNIRSIPTLLIFRSNIIVYANSGTLQAEEFERVLRAVRALDMDDVRSKVVSVNTVATGGPAPAAEAASPAPDEAAPAEEGGLLSIETYLRPALRGRALASVMPRLAASGLVVIPNAFEPDFAEQMHQSLDQCKTWRLHERYEGDFHYHHHNLYNTEEFPEDLAWCTQVFDSPATKAWVSRLSGRSCSGPAEVSASWYLPHDHSFPHNDATDSGAAFNRQVAFVWHLAKDWRSEWGGALYWCPKASYLPPAFNTLYVFNVSAESNHFVTHVSPYAQGKRLAINGWWTGPGALGASTRPGPERLGDHGSEILVY